MAIEIEASTLQLQVSRCRAICKMSICQSQSPRLGDTRQGAAEVFTETLQTREFVTDLKYVMGQTSHHLHHRQCHHCGQLWCWHWTGEGWKSVLFVYDFGIRNWWLSLDAQVQTSETNKHWLNVAIAELKIFTNGSKQLNKFKNQFIIFSCVLPQTEMIM